MQCTFRHILQECVILSMKFASVSHSFVWKTWKFIACLPTLSIDEFHNSKVAC
jgi:hypothetical protein